MSACCFCGKEIAIDKYFTRKSTCPNCGGDIHVCLNCRFYCETKHNKCIEPKAEFQRVRDKANFCDYWAAGGTAPSVKGGTAPRVTGRLTADTGGSVEEAKRKFEELFRKK